MCMCIYIYINVAFEASKNGAARRTMKPARADIRRMRIQIHIYRYAYTHTHVYTYTHILPLGSGRMEKRRTTIIAKIVYIIASLSCASILCAVVLLITNGSIRHAVFVADFRGGFPWRIFVADFQ